METTCSTCSKFATKCFTCKRIDGVVGDYDEYDFSLDCVDEFLFNVIESINVLIDKYRATYEVHNPVIDAHLTPDVEFVEKESFSEVSEFCLSKEESKN
jgi:hypothetical protein